MKVNVIKFLSRKDGFCKVFKKMQESERGCKQVLIVPEKFGVSAERALFEETGCESSFFMDITTFDRLADSYVIDKKMQYLSKSAGVMLVQKIAQDISKDLSVLSRSCSYNGFCENVFNTIMLLKSSLVSPSALLQASEELSDVSKLKLQDIEKIYEVYENTLKDRFIDSANKMDKLANELEFDSGVSETDFYIYSPKLTKQVLFVCSKLLKCAKSVTFMLDAYFDESNVYDDNEQVINELIRQAGCQVEQEKVLGNNLGLELKAVGSKRRFYEENVQFFAYANLQDEVDAVCKQIAGSGERFNDSAILVCNLEKYKTTLQKALSEYNIAHFMDTQATLVDLAPTKFLLGLINLTFEFKVERLLALIKSPYFDYDLDKVLNFELYIKRWGINERNYFSKNKPQDELFEDFEGVYNYFNGIFLSFKEKLKECKTYSEMLGVICAFLTEFEMEDKIAKECKVLQTLKEFQRAKQCEQVYKKWQTVFEQLDSILGLNATSIKDFYLVLKAGLNSVMVKTPPLMVDNVYVGDVSTAMIYGVKNLYVLGAVENSFPVYTQDCGLILDAELDKMRPVAEIDPTIRAVNRESATTILNNIVCCEKLQISYPISMFFVEQKPSTFLQQLLKLFVNGAGCARQFDKFWQTNILDDAESFAKSIVSSKHAESEMLKLVRNEEYTTSAQASKRVAGILNALSVAPYYDEVLPKIPRRLEKSSVSQLQTYYECPYRNFAKYGLRLKENLDNTLKPIDVGNFMHKVAELFGKYLIESKINYVLQENIFDTICEKALKFFEYDDDGKRGKFANSCQQTIVNNLVKSSKMMLHAINEQNKLSSFVITDVEKEIKYVLDNGEFKTTLSGKIDRVDTFGNFVRIIDYKTGNENFREADLRSGRRIQLFVYLGVLQKLNKLCPVGAYYFKIKDDFSAPFSKTDALRTYCLNGVTVDDEELIKAQDKSICQEKLSSDIIPVTCIIKDGDFRINQTRKGAYPKEKLQGFIDYAMEIFKQGTLEIAEGNIEKSPFEKACKFCEFFGVLCKGGKCRTYKIQKDKTNKGK